MNAAIVARTLSLIPDRVIRAQSGSLFDPAAQGACAHPERVTHLAQFLDWLGPLREVTKDDLRVFGLLTAYGKPVTHAAIDADVDDDADVDAELDLDLEVVEVQAEAPIPLPAEEPREPALT